MSRVLAARIVDSFRELQQSKSSSLRILQRYISKNCTRQNRRSDPHHRSLRRFPHEEKQFPKVPAAHFFSTSNALLKKDPSDEKQTSNKTEKELDKEYIAHLAREGIEFEPLENVVESQTENKTKHRVVEPEHEIESKVISHGDGRDADLTSIMLGGIEFDPPESDDKKKNRDDESDLLSDSDSDSDSYSSWDSDSEVRDIKSTDTSMESRDADLSSNMLGGIEFEPPESDDGKKNRDDESDLLSDFDSDSDYSSSDSDSEVHDIKSTDTSMGSSLPKIEEKSEYVIVQDDVVYDYEELDEGYQETEQPVDETQLPISLERGETGVFDLPDLVQLLENENARDICAIAVPAEIKYVDHMVIVSCRSVKHCRALASTVKWFFKQRAGKGDPPSVNIEGLHSTDWLAMDLGNMALHIFMPQTRTKYDLESLWTVGVEFDEMTQEHLSAEDDPFAAYLKDFGQKENVIEVEKPTTYKKIVIETGKSRYAKQASMESSTWHDDKEN